MIKLKIVCDECFHGIEPDDAVVLHEECYRKLLARLERAGDETTPPCVVEEMTERRILP